MKNKTFIAAQQLSGRFVQVGDLIDDRLPKLLEQLRFLQRSMLCLQQSIDRVKLLSKITIDPNRDCKQLPQLLHDRYPNGFKPIKDIERFIDQSE